ncbi:MAG: ABC transporter permease [Magnetococcales bacterium]|nr:ABC transporter permease [Magnetococcales bacterium]
MIHIDDILKELNLDLKDAWAGLLRRKVRSLLGSLGITIGVVAMVAMLSIGEGAKQKALDRIASLGLHTVRVEDAREGVGITNLSYGLVLADTKKISAWLGDRGSVGFFSRAANIATYNNQQKGLSTVLGVNPEWLKAEKWSVANGRPLLPEDMVRQSRVCLMGVKIASDLQVSVGSSIRLQNVPCVVIGIMVAKGRLLTEGTGLSSLDFDNTVVMPWRGFPFAKVVANEPILDGLLVTLRKIPEKEIIPIAKQIEEIIQVSHRSVKDFSMVVPLKLLHKVRETQNLFAWVMVSIASLSLLVGGIGVMNVMLANISEQTREIGLRMAIGATKKRIVSLFLCHSLLLTLSGGIMGSLLGLLAALGIQWLAGWEVAFSGVSLILGPVSAGVTGLLFGIYPALRAASLTPARALRES